MATQATFDDANFILRLYELRREAKLRDARDWFGANFKVSNMEEFQKIAPQGSKENAYVRMVVSYWDMAAAFVTSGVVNKELFFQTNGELMFVWERLKDVVPQLRETFKNPAAFKNLETVANDYIAYMEKTTPGWYEGFQGFVRGMAAAR
jgi:hypothetical protein